MRQLIHERLGRNKRRGKRAPRHLSPITALSGLVLSGLVLLTSLPALAQEAPRTPLPEAGADDPADGRIDEIVVTARKTRESLQSVPLSISALSGEQLAAAGINSFADSIAAIPNVALSGGIAGVLQGQLGIRGISTLVRNPGVESGVGIYVDGVYVGRSDNYNQELIDTAQIEVLRGPQGTLFGKNTIAGVFNITTRRPSDKVEGLARIEIGNYDLVRAQGYAMGPLSDSVAAKLSLGYVSRDGVYKHLSDGPDGDRLDLLSYRGTLYFTPGDATRIDLSVDGLRDRGNPAFFQVVDLAGIVSPMETTPLRIDNNRPNSLRRDNYGVSLTGAFDYTGGTLTSITAYRRSKFTALLDDDQSQFDLASIDRFGDTTRLFTQELRVNGEIGPTLSYVVGGYFGWQRVETDRIFALGADTGLLGDPSILTNGGVSSHTYAAFANAIWRVTDRLSVDGGLRYTKEDKHAAFTQSDTLGIGPLVGLPPLSYDRRTSDDDISPTASVSYKIVPDVMVYGRYARGFKSASFNIDLVSSVNGLFAGPENATTYEIGAKADLLDRKLRVNLALFDTKYTDIQVSQLLGSGVTLDNAGKSTIKGAELEVNVFPIAGLRLDGSAGYLDARYDRYDNCGIPTSLGGGVQASCAGNRIVGAPKWTYHLDAEYSRPVAIGEIVARIDFSGQSPVFFEATNSSRFRGDSRGVLDARIGVKTGRWDAFVWVKNFTDDRYVTYADDRSAIGVLKTAAYGDPRTVGITASVHY